MKSVAFYFSPKIHHAFGLLLIETMWKIAQSGHTNKPSIGNLFAW